MAAGYRISFLLFLLLALSSCSKTEKIEGSSIYSSTEFADLVNLHCRARKLKDLRFELANRMRFDSVQVKNEFQKRSQDSIKDVKARESRLLADSISAIISDLTLEMKPEEKRSFNDSLSTALGKMKCES